MPALHLSTLISRSPSSILSHLSHLSKSFPSNPLLFSLSHNASPNDLSTIVNQLSLFSSDTVGCLSAPLPGPYSPFTTCSLAVFDPEDISTFRSTIPGKQQAQVGRWRPVGQQRKRDERPLGQQQGQSSLSDVKDWEDVWNGNNEKMAALPSELEGLSPGDVASVIYMTDSSPEGLSRSLSRFVDASKVGLLASSTPFVTGRPVTLFHNGDVYDSGAVGIVLKNKNKKATMANLSANVSSLGLVPISQPMPITQCEGNMITSIDNKNPTQLLLSHIRDSGLGGDWGNVFKSEMQFSLGTVENGRVGQVLNITAGDPSRGTISLDAQRSPAQGSLVQFLHRMKPTNDPLSRHGIFFTPYVPTESSSLIPPKSFNFLSVTDDVLAPQSSASTLASVEETFVLGDTFLAASENGFLFGGGKTQADDVWRCAIPGTLSNVEFA